jgi:UDP-4-amino-4,6-dideoxy-N-acetyl-beta-L-altrosamine N-acetyltransferase
MFTFRRLRREDLELVLKWRFSPHVTRYMNTDIVPDIHSQINWFNKLPHPILYWIVVFDDLPIGLINLSDVNYMHGRTSFGYYIGEREYWHLGGLVLPYFYNYVFATFPIHKIVAEVFYLNPIWRMHLTHGYRLVGTFLDHVYKNNEYHSVSVLELHKADWERNTKWNKFVCKFE